ncbi:MULTISPECIES: phytoene/squalene synthase family protein [unclassified Imperialibacter]|uniref:phytoene/squalene synthase family protein n=1 Tax=unclassified Imperialibacter TaxID=2629706 RepID=UPI00125C4240|nr:MULTISPECIES: phytoene/squalene synthase family protein [unclassified Imperialibacter]CAD5246275.1 Phytoene/squalene synthetase [Imperialibacter sp. 75]CAD5246307.1 Phytoene/squalene synthetase [Imperialibacter sp. 89]VVS96078.1 Phytoene synthase [Imperialibacter sp. EC-SDR9]
MNHIDLFDSTALKVSQLVTERYSTSFTLGIKTLHKKFRDPVFAIYGFVRYADEIVDTFHDHNKKMLLERFRKDTYDAIDEKLSFNPILHSFQSVVNQYKIESELIDAFLHSMEMDILQNEYNESGYQEYIYGSAEVVGLMCLRVFCEGDDKEFQSLKAPARRLGAAFQKVNFLRDIKSDFKDRGRTYFPGVDFNNFSQISKAQIESDIQQDFDAAYEGIKRLPKGARLGVYLAYVYYLTLFSKIKRLPVTRIMTERIRIPDSKKIILLFQTYLKHSLNGF